MSVDKKAKAAERQREYRKQDPDRYREYDLKKHFGITLNDYNTMLKNQNNVCAICGNPETEVCNKKEAVRNLAVDHCHRTGKIRGLLCRGCNQGLGNFRDNPDFLAKAISYIINEGP
jgi:hypothetical protein